MFQHKGVFCLCLMAALLANCINISAQSQKNESGLVATAVALPCDTAKNLWSGDCEFDIKNNMGNTKCDAQIKSDSNGTQVIYGFSPSVYNEGMSRKWAKGSSSSINCVGTCQLATPNKLQKQGIYWATCCWTASGEEGLPLAWINCNKASLVPKGQTQRLKN